MSVSITRLVKNAIIHPTKLILFDLVLILTIFNKDTIFNYISYQTDIDCCKAMHACFQWCFDMWVENSGVYIYIYIYKPVGINMNLKYTSLPISMDGHFLTAAILNQSYIPRWWKSIPEEKSRKHIISTLVLRMNLEVWNIYISCWDSEQASIIFAIKVITNSG